MNAASEPRVIVALDYPRAAEALTLARRLDPAQCRLKVGKELYTAEGPALVEQLQRAGYSVFLDLKFHDIPNTVAAACTAAAAIGVWMLNVHALGGRAMMSAAREALAARAGPPPRLVAVTVLTSLGEADLVEIGLAGDPQQAALRLARLARDCGLDGVVCSPQETPVLRRTCGTGFMLVTPGVRPKSAARDDQHRVATPAQAIAGGADYIVIGRPITRAPDPLAALQAILGEIA